MGISGGGGSTSGSAQKWAQPYAKAAASSAQGVYDANQGNLQQMSSDVQGLMPGLINQFQQGNAGVDAANSYATDVLGGKYLNGNPYMSGMIDQTANDVTGRVNANFGSRGSFGGTAHTAALGTALANAENQMRYGNYSDEMSRMAQAASMTPQLAQAEYTGLNPILQTAGVGAELPYTGINALSNNLGSLFNGGKTKGPGIGTSILGGFAEGAGKAVGAAAMASDPRLKTNIEKVGEFDDGLGIYHWNYIWGGPRHEGVMADEVATLRPWALGPKIAGEYLTVNYGAL